MEELVRGTARRYDEQCDDVDALAGMGFAIAMNSLKVSASTLVVDIVGRAMAICGMAGYREDSPYSLGRILRDAHGRAVMVNNDRIIGNNAQMLLDPPGGVKSPPATTDAHFRDELVAAGHLIPTGIDGIYGRSAVYEDIVAAVDRLAAAGRASEGAISVRFPPVMPRHVFEQTGYL